MSLTSSQASALRVVSRLEAGHGYSPTVREVAAEVGFAVTWTHTLLAALQAQGLIAWRPHTPRTLRVTDAGRMYLDREVRA